MKNHYFIRNLRRAGWIGLAAALLSVSRVPAAPPLAWPDGVIYYEFDSTVVANSGMPAYLKNAMDTWSQSGVRVAFVPRNGAAVGGYVRFTYGSGGNHTSPLGYPGTTNTSIININNVGRNDLYFPVHEIGHLLGFDHEMKRPDRDTYITVHLENISDTYQYDPPLAAANIIYDVNTYGFNFNSIMMYSQCFTITNICNCPKDPNCPYGGRSMDCKSGYEQYQDTMGPTAFHNNNDVLRAVDVNRASSVYGSGTVRYLDQTSTALPSLGTLANPYLTVDQAQNGTPSGGRVFGKGVFVSSSPPGTFRLNKPLTWRAYPNTTLTIVR